MDGTSGNHHANFHHPYSPYDIQLQFMQSLYSCLEQSKVAVFESPTGTGKSLSLICGSLTWLRDHKRRAFQDTVASTTCDEDEPEWMLEFAKRESTRAITEKKNEIEARLAKTRLEEEKILASENERPRKKQKLESVEKEPNQQGDDQFALDEYDSETEERKPAKEAGQQGDLSASTLALLEHFKGQISVKPKDQDEDEETKIFYCSRTHSQLSQFASELRRVNMPSSIPEELTTGEEVEERLKHLSLGSRKNLCINPKVSGLQNPTAINERCLDLQQSGVAAEHKCPYLPSKDNEALSIQFRDHTLATVKDIEDIGRVGKRIGICPYYASRSVVKHSEIVTLPYPLLLQKSARDALNLSVKNHIVIIDEAHNLMDAIANIHSASVTLSQLQSSMSQLTTYARKFKNRLKGKNRTYVAQVIRLVSSIADYLQSVMKNSSAPEGSVQASDLMAGKGVDQINPYKLSQFLQESKLARKVDGYVENVEENKPSSGRTTTPVLFNVQGFLLPLMNPSAEGRLFYLKNQGGIQLTYMLLDPTNHFREIVEDARAVILAGGTMSPMSDYATHLFSYVPSDRLDTFSYGHVIPSENLMALTLPKGIGGLDFDFTYDARDSEKMIMDLGRTIGTICRVIPDGVVAFFPSYDYLSRVLSIWKRPTGNANGETILRLIEQRKPVLYESREAGNSEELLQKYSSAIESGSGGLLLSVVGGKLSEGINFSDKLGRGVLVIGLPFPNIRSAVWQAKIQYLEQKTYQQASGSEASRQSTAKAAGREFYENACMRAVNQCIGRAIRHRNDYAAIVMIDRRYSKPHIQGKLPGWIRQSLVGDTERPGTIINGLSKFFRGRASIDSPGVLHPE